MTPDPIGPHRSAPLPAAALPEPDRRPGVRVGLAARLVAAGRDPAEVAALTGVPLALLTLGHRDHHDAEPGPVPHPAPGPVTDVTGHAEPGRGLAAAIRRTRRRRRVALGAALGFAVNAGLALAAAVPPGTPSLAAATLIAGPLLGGLLWLLVLAELRALPRPRPRPRANPPVLRVGRIGDRDVAGTSIRTTCRALGVAGSPWGRAGRAHRRYRPR